MKTIKNVVMYCMAVSLFFSCSDAEPDPKEVAESRSFTVTAYMGVYEEDASTKSFRLPSVYTCPSIFLVGQCEVSNGWNNIECPVTSSQDNRVGFSFDVTTYPIERKMTLRQGTRSVTIRCGSPMYFSSRAGDEADISAPNTGKATPDSKDTYSHYGDYLFRAATNAVDICQAGYPILGKDTLRPDRSNVLEMRIERRTGTLEVRTILTYDDGPVIMLGGEPNSWTTLFATAGVDWNDWSMDFFLEDCPVEYDLRNNSTKVNSETGILDLLDRQPASRMEYDDVEIVGYGSNEAIQTKSFLATYDLYPYLFPFNAEANVLLKMPIYYKKDVPGLEKIRMASYPIPRIEPNVHHVLNLYIDARDLINAPVLTRSSGDEAIQKVPIQAARWETY